MGSTTVIEWLNSIPIVDGCTPICLLTTCIRALLEKGIKVEICPLLLNNARPAVVYGGWHCYKASVSMRSTEGIVEGCAWLLVVVETDLSEHVLSQTAREIVNSTKFEKWLHKKLDSDVAEVNEKLHQLLAS